MQQASDDAVISLLAIDNPPFIPVDNYAVAIVRDTAIKNSGKNRNPNEESVSSAGIQGPLNLWLSSSKRSLASSASDATRYERYTE